MKNREKYRDKIIKIVLSRETCNFMRTAVVPLYIDRTEDIDNFCNTNSCESCSKLFAFWLDEEYEETPKPEVDWNKVDVDTLVRVRDHDYEEWTLKYFKGIDDELPANRYVVWQDGATSITAYGYTEHWTYCELVEHEDSSC